MLLKGVASLDIMPNTTGRNSTLKMAGCHNFRSRGSLKHHFNLFYFILLIILKEREAKEWSEN